MPPKKEKTSLPDYPQLGRMLVEASLNDDGCKPLPGLYLVATPIGHLGDITLRALILLAQADVIACEDTRNSGILLQAFGIKKPMFSCHDHNEESRSPEIIKRIVKGEIVALISDAGMPAIADPGFKLVRECRKAGLNVIVIPGANAALTAIAGSGLPTDQFYFIGFLPSKTVARRKELSSLRAIEATLICYEAPQRLATSLLDLSEILGEDRPCVVARELTKFYEENRLATLGELATYYETHEVKGEIVILVGKGTQKIDLDIDALLNERLKKLSVRDAVAEIAEMSGSPKKEIYARALLLGKHEK